MGIVGAMLDIIPVGATEGAAQLATTASPTAALKPRRPRERVEGAWGAFTVMGCLPRAGGLV